MDEETWFLQKISPDAENEIYGPTTLGTLQAWAAAAKISPMDRISGDNKQTWLRAPMIPELQMDWLIELEEGRLYGPTNLGTIQGFLKTEEINERTLVINCLENTRQRIKDITVLRTDTAKVARDEQGPVLGSAIGSRADSIESRVRILEERVKLLEATIMRQQNL